jgi:hypothetical protein
LSSKSSTDIRLGKGEFPVLQVHHIVLALIAGLSIASSSPSMAAGEFVTACGSIPEANARRFGADLDALDLLQHGKNYDPPVCMSSSHTLLYFDISAMMKGVSLECLRQASWDFERYKDMMPGNILKSQVASDEGSARTACFETRTSVPLRPFGSIDMSSRHCLQAMGFGEGFDRPDAEVPSGDSAIEWHHPPGQKDSLFTKVDGSWFMEPMPDGSVYVRYFMAAESKQSSFLVNVDKLKIGFKNQVKQAVNSFEREAKRRQSQGICK